MRVLTGGRLIDGTGAGPVDATIVIKDQRIEAVETRAYGEWPADAEIIDVSGMTVLPGLIDCHDHLAMHGYDLARRWGIDEPQTTRTLRTAKVLADTLASGYTTVRDAAGLDAGFKRAIDEGLDRRPAADRLIVHHLADRRHRRPGQPVRIFLLRAERSAAARWRRQQLADVRPVVRRVVRAGADVIKCATTGGASSRPGHGPHDGAFNLDEMQALVEEAHALDRRVICHALGGRGLRIAVEAGVDFDRPWLLSRPGTRTAGDDGPARHLFCADLCGLRLPPQIAAAACPRAGAALAKSTMSRACARRSPPGSRSPPGPMPAATAIRRMRSRSPAWSGPG